MSTKKKSDKLQCLRFQDLVRLGIVGNRMTLRRWIQKGVFPAPIVLGPRMHVWRAAEVEKCLEECERVTFTKDSTSEA